MGVKMLKDEETQGEVLEEAKKLPYPKAVFFITINEFCERFCYFGMRTVLSLYLTEYLFYSESDATVIYHTFVMLAYFFPIFGAMTADGFLGRYRTILYISMIYATGGILLSLSAITPLGLPHKECSLLALFLIASGTGGIKPCVLPLGGDQFVLPHQERLMAQYFSIFYFAINVGSLFSTVLTPILRENVHCFEENSCFPLAFGLPSMFMITAIVIIILGKPFIKIFPPEGSLLYKVTACMCHSVKVRFTSNIGKVDHWLDRSKPKYGEKLVEDIKRTFNVVYMFLPMPILWALIDQMGTTWTFQARRMNGDIGFYTILPDQMQLGNAIFYLSFIPICEYLIYPVCRKIKFLTTTLQKITTGGVIAALGFVCASCVSLVLETTYPVLPSTGNGQIRLYNTLPCNVNITTNLANSGSVFLASGSYYKNIDIELSGNKNFSYFLQSDCANFSGNLEVYEEKAVGYYFDSFGENFFEDDVSKHLKGLPQVRTLVNSAGQHYNVTYKNSKGQEVIATNSSDYSLYSISPDIYQIIIGNYEYEYKFYLGGVYAVLAIPNSGETTFNIVTTEVTAANSIHMLWSIPQYVLLTLGELMFSIPSAEFAYSQAPVSMKSVVMSCLLLTNALGNLLVVVIEAASVFELASSNGFLYAGLMLLAMVVFAFMAKRYKYVEIEKPVTPIEQEMTDYNKHS